MTIATSVGPTRFAPQYKTIDTIDVFPEARLLQGETMFYQSTPEFVFDKGGPIAREFVDKLPNDLMGRDTLIDVRVHHLRPGNYPAIPGYHLDWIPRKDQGRAPDLSVIPDYQHVILIVAETCLTEYVAEEIEISNLHDGDPAQAFRRANDYIKAQGIKTERVINGDMVWFTSNDWHRPVAAERSEWRLFIRASKVSHVRASNQIRTQAQVYVPFEEAGW